MMAARMRACKPIQQRLPCSSNQNIIAWAQQAKSRYCCRATTFYFNQAKVREAVHADPVQDAGFFTFGNYRVDYTYDFFNTIPLNQELINSGGVSPRQRKCLSLLVFQSACALWQEEDQQQGQEAARGQSVLYRASYCTSTFRR